jgi:hypothetical protein
MRLRGVPFQTHYLPGIEPENFGSVVRILDIIISADTVNSER